MNGLHLLALILAGWVGGLAALAGIATLAARRREKRLHRAYFDLRESYTPGQMRAVLRHPVHRKRCSCRRYGLPETNLEVRDTIGQHSATRCQPATELLEDER